jgi:hypothetical protein
MDKAIPARALPPEVIQYKTRTPRLWSFASEKRQALRPHWPEAQKGRQRRRLRQDVFRASMLHYNE